MRALVVGLALLLAGCATLPRLVDPIAFPAVVRYAAGDIRSVVGEPALLLAGHEVPDDGYLLTVGQWRAVRDEVERLSGALVDAYGQIEDDRTLCSVRVDATAEVLRQCRREGLRAFWTGAALGLGVCGAGVGAASMLRP